MYTIDEGTGAITFPDGLVVNPPYDHPRYSEYAYWVNAGNTPNLTPRDPWVAEDPIEVSAAQARSAMAELGVYEMVEAFMANPAIPQKVRLRWLYSNVFRRNDPDVIAMAKLLGWEVAQLDHLFTVAQAVA